MTSAVKGRKKEGGGDYELTASKIDYFNDWGKWDMDDNDAA